MYSQIHSAVLLGIDGYPVSIETHMVQGLPHYQVVGLPGQVIKESKERVKSALATLEYTFPMHKITQNIAPANLRKEGEQLDLPMAMGILSCHKAQIQTALKDVALLGEIALDGRIKPVRGILSLLDGLRKNGITEVIIPQDNYNEASVFEDLSLYPFDHLKTLVGAIEVGGLEPVVKHKQTGKQQDYSEKDFSEVKGQNHVLRAIEVAIAGKHNILLIGPPGCGKTMIAERMTSIMKNLTLDEQIEITKIYSVAEGMAYQDLISQRPVRMPHHSISRASLLGGGHRCLPGEISKAHLGILVLDELAEFKKEVLESLREPMSLGKIAMVKYQKAIEFPADFMLVATMNPCPCGYYMSKTQSCICTDTDRKRYRQKLSGPILDRIDIVIMMDKAELEGDDTGATYSSQLIRSHIENMRKDQVAFLQEEKVILNRYYDKGKLSMRGYQKIVGLAKTIAKLDGASQIESHHLYEAMHLHGQFREQLL